MRKLIITDADKDAIRAEIEKRLASMVNAPEKFTVPISPSIKKGEKATVYISDVAEKKIFGLVNHFSSEVAWYGTVVRAENGPIYAIKDIFVHPQVASGATVEDSDDETFDTWSDTLDDDTFNALKMQGHSHVNMGVTPSGTDLNDQDMNIKTLSGESFYIYMICNRRREIWMRIYDRKYNCVFDKEDIDILLDSEASIVDFLEEADKQVKKVKPKVWSYQKGKRTSYPTLIGYDEAPEDELYDYIEKLTK